MDVKPKRIVLVTSSQPSLNPRLVKEADAFVEAGYDVTVVGQYWNDWANETDKILLPAKKWKFIRVGGSPKKSKFSYSYTRIIHKLFRKLAQHVSLKFGIAELSIGRCGYQLYNTAKNLKADLYIGHNPGGLAPAINAALHNGVKSGFDAEDFHRLEYSDDPTHPDVKCKTYLEEKYFPKASYLITASPLITLEYKKIFPLLDFNSILNVFPRTKDLEVKKSTSNQALKLFWFSQTIGPNRGLDEAIEAIKIIGSPLIEIHALGFPRQQVIEHYTRVTKSYGFLDSQLTFYPPIPPDEIYAFASNFDIGLATEIGVPFNRNICLTNKIFTYIQSGLAVAASNTSAQEDLLRKYPDCGKLFDIKNAESLAAVLRFYLNDRGALYEAKQASFEYGQQTLNWETESKKFLKIVEETLEA